MHIYMYVYIYIYINFTDLQYLSDEQTLLYLLYFYYIFIKDVSKYMKLLN